MLHLPTLKEKPKFQRHGATCTWFGAACQVINTINEGTSLASTCFVADSVAREARAHLEAGGNLSTIFEARVLDSLEEFLSHFLCIGFYRQDKLVGFWDVPLIWLEGKKHLQSKDLESPEFLKLMGAAQAYASAHPMPMPPPEEETVEEDEIDEDAAVAEAKPAGEDAESIAAGIATERLENKELADAIIGGMPPAVALDLEIHNNVVELSPDDLAPPEVINPSPVVASLAPETASAPAPAPTKVATDEMDLAFIKVEMFE